MQDDRFEAMKKTNFRIAQCVRLKWELEPPVDIPTGAIGRVTRISPWGMCGSALKSESRGFPSAKWSILNRHSDSDVIVI
jgi:hypothetical protein